MLKKVPIRAVGISLADHYAGEDIETVRAKGGKKFNEIINMIRKYISKHTADSIKKV